MCEDRCRKCHVYELNSPLQHSCLTWKKTYDAVPPPAGHFVKQLHCKPRDVTAMWDFGNNWSIVLTVTGNWYLWVESIVMYHAPHRWWTQGTTALLPSGNWGPKETYKTNTKNDIQWCMSDEFSFLCLLVSSHTAWTVSTNIKNEKNLIYDACVEHKPMEKSLSGRTLICQRLHFKQNALCRRTINLKHKPYTKLIFTFKLA